MNDDRFEDALAEELAAYQEKLERGVSGAGVPGEPADARPLPPELQQELEENKRCLEMLHALRTPQRFSGKPAYRHEHDSNARSVERFERLDELGAGGFGIVWRARDPATGRIVALKVPRPEVLASPELRKRFEQEGEAAARLDHPNIVPILEAGTDGIVPYIASTYYEGPTLAQWLSDHQGRVVPRQAALIALALARALTHAHERGVLHRDVKPSNVLLAPVVGGETRELPFEPKLMDFGLAKLGERDQELTRTGAMLGTLKYMAPEQAAGRAKEITAATDVYGLGVVLYEMLTGEPPFSGDSDWLTLRKVLEDEPRSVSSVRRDVPRDLAVIVQKCLFKTPTQRYHSARELAEDLQRFLEGKTIVARPVPPAERLAKWCRRNPAWAALVGVVTLTIVSGVAFLSYSNVRIAALLADAQRWSQLLTIRLYASDMRRADEAMEQGNLALADELLRQYAEPANGPDVREFAWHFLWGRLPHQELFLPKHPGHVYSLSFAPNGQRIATGCADGFVRVWQRGAKEPERILSCQKAEVNEVVFSPDGRLLAAACEDGLTRIWDTGDWSLRHEFPIGGVITTEYFGGFDSWNAVAVQENGMIVTAGQALRNSPGNSDAYVSRYKPNGQIDTSFNQVGDALVWKYGAPDSLMAVIVEPDGKIVAAGTAQNSDFAIARLQPDGSHDEVFGDQGEVMVDLGSDSDHALAAARQSDGKYLLAGSTKRGTDFDAAMIRLHSDGRLDESFADGGKLIVDIGKADDSFEGIALQPDGKIIAVGCTSTAPNTSESGETLVVRYNLDGTLDPSFAQGGILVLRVSDSLDRAQAVALQPDGKIVLAGEALEGARHVAIVMRLETDGAPDEKFGERGIVKVDFDGTRSEFRDLVLQPDGKILAVGLAGDVAPKSSAMARLNADGSLDQTFGVAGRIHQRIGIGSELNSVALQDDGKFVVAGNVLCGGTKLEHVNFAVARFNSNGSLDRSFSPNGVQAIKFLPDSRRLVAYAEQCVQLWDVGSGERLAETFVPEFSVDAADVSVDGKRIITAGDRLLTNWDVDALSVPLGTDGIGDVMSALAALPADSTLAIGCRNGDLLVYDMARQATLKDLNPGRNGYARAIRLSPDHQMLAAIFENTALVYRTTDWSLAAEIVSPERVYDVQFRSDVQTMVTAAGDGIVMEWPIPKAGEAAFGDAGRRLFQAESRIRAMAVTADESLIACGQDDGKISLIKSETGQVQFETVPLASTVRGLGFSNQQQELIVGYASGAVLSVNLSDQSVKTRLSLGQPIQKLIVSADGSKVAVTLDETSKLRAYTWPQARQLVEIEYRGSMSHMAFTQGGKQLIVSAGPYLDVFDASTGKRLGGDAELGTGYSYFQVYRDDSQLVVAEGSKGITIRELPSCRVLKRMLGSAAGIQRVAVSADGRNFASDGHEHLLRIWDAQTSETLLMLTDENGTGYAEELHFSRDGQRLIGIEGRSLTVWESRPVR